MAIVPPAYAPPKLMLVSRGKRPSLGALFMFLAAGFAGVAFVAADAGGPAWAVAFASGVLALWMGELALRALR